MAEEEEHTLFLLTGSVYVSRLMKQKRKHRWWIKSIIRNRTNHGTYHHLVRELELSNEEFQCYFRLTREQFAEILATVEEDLSKKCLTREAISAKERLAICLR